MALFWLRPVDPSIILASTAYGIMVCVVNILQ